MPSDTLIFKICPARAWQEALKSGHFAGSSDDVRDGFIHFSAAHQLRVTAAKHFAGQGDLVLVAVEAPGLGAALKWEPSRGGDLFPHLYGDMPVAAARWVKPLPLGADGVHIFPELAP